MNDCIYCSIINRDAGCFKIFENDKYLAILDIKPISEGHTIVMTKNHYPTVWDVPNIGEFFNVCKQVVRHFQGFGDDVFSMVMQNEVKHAHMHIIPRIKTLGFANKFAGSFRRGYLDGAGSVTQHKYKFPNVKAA